MSDSGTLNKKSITLFNNSTIKDIDYKSELIIYFQGKAIQKHGKKSLFNNGRNLAE